METFVSGNLCYKLCQVMLPTVVTGMLANIPKDRKNHKFAVHFYTCNMIIFYLDGITLIPLLYGSYSTACFILF